MNTATFIAAAGVDPYVKAEEVVSARPGEVQALGEAFEQAAAALSESGSLAGIAGSLADASTVFDGSPPTELIYEVQAVQASLSAGPEQLAAIGGPLCQLADALWQVQLEVSAVLMAMEEECVAVALSYQAAQAVPLAAPLDLAPQFTSQGAAVVQAAHQQITSVVDAHDAFADSILVSLQDAGYLIPPDVDAAVVDILGATGTPQCPVLPDGDPSQIAAWWASRTPAEQAQLIQQHPELIAQLPGLPPDVYDLVNRRGLSDAHIPLLPKVEEALQTLYDEGLVEQGTTIEDVMALHHSELTKIGLFSIASNNALNTLKDLFPAWQKVTHTQASVADTDVEHYLLEYEIDAYGGDGSAVIAIGETDSAENIALVVQGATHDLTTIDSQTADAQAVLDQMNEHGDSNAVIVYAGYDNPDIAQAAFSANAQAGGSALADDIDGYIATYEQEFGAGADPNLTLIGHSYGTTTSAYALQAGANEHVDALVVYGSPGLDVEHASELGLPAGQVYAAINSSDVLDGLLDELEDQLQMHTFGLSVLGMDPAGPGFGSTVVSSEGVDGHGDYFEYDDGVPNDALYNAGAISAGEYDKVKK
ncbi:alpha/beta hydrolase [Blastococcus sp. Marseille-P5729]|uniref:alpha/beta hydrolase n=1 Tax=Blastococcus sp. Marseille-P5729 TaxID=2086582 RepID=UPI000D103F06|nr:alpha/beta hydrolase [Blastococcus sp. Marseille-P5729]